MRGRLICFNLAAVNFHHLSGRWFLFFEAMGGQKDEKGEESMCWVLKGMGVRWFTCCGKRERRGGDA